MTLNQLVQNIEAISDAHYQINSFGFGDIYDITTSGDINYPLMWMVLESVDIGENSEKIKFNLIFSDIVKGGRVNELEVLSDQLQIAKDVVSQLSYHGYDWAFDANNIVFEPFTERFTDSVSGYSVLLEISIPFDSNRCSIPTSNVVITAGGSASTGGGGSGGGTIYLYVNGVLQSTTLSSDLDAEIVNVLWT